MKSKSMLHVAIAMIAWVSLHVHADPSLTAKRYNFAPSPAYIDPISNLLDYSPSSVWRGEGPLTKLGTTREQEAPK